MAACARAQREPVAAIADNADASAPAGDDEVDDTNAPPTVAETKKPEDRGPKPAGIDVIAFAVQAPIFNAPEWPAKDPSKSDDRHGVQRVGYLRRGEHALARDGLIKQPNCAEGWYELIGREKFEHGYVCGKFVTTDPHHRDLKFAPHLPYLDKSLPYEYGLNLTPGTPLYRRLPLKSERKENEKTLALGKGKKASDIAKQLQESGEQVPAYLKDTGNAKSTVHFDDLKGDSELVAQRMLKGFYISLDKKVDGRSGVFWHTMSGYMAPKDHLIVHESKTEFEGVDLTAGDRKLPLAFVIGTRANQTTMNPEDKSDGVTRGDHIDRFTILGLTGKHEAAHDRVYWETEKGFMVRDMDVAVVQLPKIPTDIQPGERWVDVDLSTESLVAFEGEKPVYATIVSTGRRNADPEKDHPTPTGTFHIREKHISTTMDDDGASDGTYRIEDVPWVMYFEKSIALHGAFWHSSFGREKSHGCVNLTPYDAHHIFDWAGPQLPEGWHGVKATKNNPGTRVVVHK